MIDKDISCKELAAQLEVNDNTVSNWRKNETQSGQVMQKLADFFEMTVSELVSLGE